MNETTLHPSSELNSQNTRLFAWIVWSLGALFFFYEFLLQIAPSVMSNELMRTFSISATEFGILTSFYFISYATMQVPAGILLDRFGPRALLTFASCFCAIGSLIFGFAHHFHFVELARFITGLGSAFAMLGALVLVANWFPTNRFAFIHGLTITIGMLGAVFGGYPMSLVVQTFAWRPSMIALGLAGIAITLLIWFIVRDRPQQPLAENHCRHENISTKEVLWALADIVKHPQSWIISLYGVLMYAPTTAMAWWGPSFIESAFHTSKGPAAAMNSIIFIGWCFGSPIFGYLSDHIGRRKLPLYISSVFTLLSLLGIIYFTPDSLFLLGVLMFCFGFFTCGFIPSFSIIRELHTSKASGTALGFMNMINNFGGAIAPPLVGFGLDFLWDGKIVDNTPIYGLTTYQHSLLILPISIFLALVILPIIPETFCKTKEQSSAENN